MDQQPWSHSETTCAICNYHNTAFHSAPGARVSFGYFKAPQYGDFIVQYTYLHASGFQQVDAPSQPGAYLDGTRSIPIWERLHPLYLLHRLQATST